MSNQRFSYTLVANWPRLAWVAQLKPGCETIQIFHGHRVEVNEKWYCEAVWDGDYSDGGFDQTDIVAGTGARVRANQVTFVTAGNTLDRLHYVRVDGDIFLSNSLPGLLSISGGQVDRAYPQYLDDLGSIVNGLGNYERELKTSAGQVHLVYFNNLLWNGYKLEEVEKPARERDFSTFLHYQSFLDCTMAQLAQNLADPSRRFPYQMMSTLSSGYDSPTVSVLARKAGCMEALCFTEAQGGVQENGPAIAEVLGLKPIAVDREAWRACGEFPEATFIVADGKGMDLLFKGAETILEGRVLLTGYHGDKMWDKNTFDVSRNVVRGDPSGLSLSEFRLQAGFLHCAVPFWGVREIREVQAISVAKEMLPWDVPGDYSRPICRRIVEEAGIERSMFGTRKAAAAFQFGYSEDFLSRPSMSDYRSWLKAHRADWIARGLRPSLRRIRLVDSAVWLGVNSVSSFSKALLRWSEGKAVVWRLTKSNFLIETSRIKRTKRLRARGIRMHVFPWALEKAVRVYGQRNLTDYRSNR